jgi:hypothetical protein
MAAAPTSTVFSALATELAHASAGVDQLAVLVCDYVRDRLDHDRPAAVQEAQALDAVGQHLQALCELARALARGEPIETAIDAVPLADLANRLRATTHSSAPVATPAPTAGELVLFD